MLKSKFLFYLVTRFKIIPSIPLCDVPETSGCSVHVCTAAQNYSLSIFNFVFPFKTSYDPNSLIASHYVISIFETSPQEERTCMKFCNSFIFRLIFGTHVQKQRKSAHSLLCVFPSVCICAFIRCDFHWTDFREISFLGDFHSNLSTKIQI